MSRFEIFQNVFEFYREIIQTVCIKCRCANAEWGALILNVRRFFFSSVFKWTLKPNRLLLQIHHYCIFRLNDTSIPGHFVIGIVTERVSLDSSSLGCRSNLALKRAKIIKESKFPLVVLFIKSLKQLEHVIL